jgi:phage-related protein
MKIDPIKMRGQGDHPTLRIAVADVDQTLVAYIENQKIIGQDAEFSVVTSELLDNIANRRMFRSRIIAATCSFGLNNNAAFVLGDYDLREAKVPAWIITGHYCQYRYKDRNCKYTGSETSCDKKYLTCLSYGNQENYGGFLAIPQVHR